MYSKCGQCFFLTYHIRGLFLTWAKYDYFDLNIYDFCKMKCHKQEMDLPSGFVMVLWAISIQLNLIGNIEQKFNEFPFPFYEI